LCFQEDTYDFSLVFSGPFGVIDEHFNSVLPNCYDAIGLMLMIQIIHKHQVMFYFVSLWIFSLGEKNVSKQTPYW